MRSSDWSSYVCSSDLVSVTAVEMPAELLAHARAAKGFMPEDEGLLLHRVARDQLSTGPGLEVGTYCGKSAIYVGAAAREVGGVLFTVDHHRGPEENQAGARQGAGVGTGGSATGELVGA